MSVHEGSCYVQAIREEEIDRSKRYLHGNHIKLTFRNNIQLQWQLVVPPFILTRYLQLETSGLQSSQ